MLKLDWCSFGKLTHNRSISSKYGGKKNIPCNIKIEIPPPQKKHLFIKRIKHKSNAAANHADKGGAVPTDALHLADL